jgi:hypothetical protein
MSSLSKQGPLNPNDPSYYAPRWLRERAEARLSASHETIPEPVRSPVTTVPEPASPIAAPASLDIQLKNAIQLKKAVSNAWDQLDPEVIHEPARFARELDRRAALQTVAARFAAAAGVVSVVALFFFILVPASRQPKPIGPASQQSDASSPTSEITGPLKTALPQPGEEDGGSKPMVPASRESNARSTTSEITGSVKSALPQPGGGSKPMVPASRGSNAGSTTSEITRSVKSALPQPGEGEGGSKPMVPASRESDAGSTSSEVTGSVGALPQSGQRDGGSRPALAEFQGILVPAPASQPATHDQSQQLLQQFLRWSQKASSPGTSQ